MYRSEFSFMLKPSPLAAVPKERAAYALREIKAGEELLIDYNDLDEPEHLKEDYYKRT